MNSLFNVTVKDNRELLSLVKKGNKYHAIVYLKSKDEYVACYGYNITNGTWGQGHYCLTYDDALEELINILSN